ncbi:unnamed protein product [Urochloa humidicola]
MLASAAGSPAGKQEVAWCLRPPFAQQSGMPLPLPCPYLMSAHHNRYLLSQDHQGWRRGAQQDARCLHVSHADTAIRRSSWSAGIASRWPSTVAPSPSTAGRSGGGSSSSEQACWMTMNKQQQQAPSSKVVAMPNLEISLGRQGWQHNNNLHDQQQRSGESTTAPKELTLLKCL